MGREGSNNTHATQNDKERDDCIKSLGLTSANPRAQKIKSAYGETFNWIWDESSRSPGFLRWAKHGLPSNFYYIRGKPGAGKSTLMKFICDELVSRTTGSTPITIISYFFHELGTPNETSSRGCLSSLLRQFLQNFPGLAQTVFTIFENTRRKCGMQDFMWELETLEKALIDVIRKLDSGTTICIFIDGIDECEDRTSRRDCLLFLKLLVKEAANSSLNVRLCVSSRPQNGTDHLLQEAHGFKIQDYTKNDILNYVKAELKTPSITETREHFQFGSVQDSLINDIAGKADGIFLWAALTLREIKDKIDDGEHDNALQQCINDQSGDVRDLYSSIIERIFRTSGIKADDVWDYLALFCFPHKHSQYSNSQIHSELTLFDLSFVSESLDGIKRLSYVESRGGFNNKARCIKAGADLQKICGNILEVIGPSLANS